MWVQNVYGYWTYISPKGSLLDPLINRSKVKLSYRCTPNMNYKMSNHNKNLLESKEEEPKCNCRNKAECPLPERCLKDKVIYRAKVTTNSEIQTYVGLTAGEFKTRYRKHTSDFNNLTNKNSTTLSS